MPRSFGIPDRAQYLARTLIGRIAHLQASFAEDGRGEPDRGQRIATIEKVLATELGITDGATLSVIESALPNVKRARDQTDQEIARFAAFLRERLGRQLTEL